MKITVKIILILSLSISALLVNGQETELNNAQEIGLQVFGRNNLSVIYKKQKSKNEYFRLSAADVSFSLSDNFNRLGGHFSGDVLFGKEKRSDLFEEIQFLSGWQFNTSFNYSYSNTGFLNLGLGVGYLFGGRYDINEKFAVSLEAIPMIRVNGTFSGNSFNIFRFNANGNAGLNNTTSLVFVYKF